MIEQRTLPPEPASASAARRFATEVLETWREGELCDVVTLLVSELVTNAVLHTGSSVEVAVRRRGKSLRVEVSDNSPVIPGERDFSLDATTGRGLALVQALSESWGIESIPRDGKVVWFEVPSATGTFEPIEQTGDAVIALPDDEVVIRLLSAPVHLFPAMQQHTEALLREFALIAIQYDSAGEAAPHLPVDVRAISAQLRAAVEAGKATANLVVAAPAAAHASIEHAREALDIADRLAADGQLLSAAALPEVRWCREWFLHQVLSQLEGDDPRPWATAGIRTDRRAPLQIDPKIVLDHLTDAIVVADDENHIAYVNHATEKLLGWPEGMLEGQRLTAIIPERLHEAHVSGYSRYLVTREARLLGRPVAVPARRCDNTEVDVELTITAVTPPGGGRELFVAILRSPRADAEPPHKARASSEILDGVVAALGSGRATDVPRDAAHLLKVMATTVGATFASWWNVDGDQLRSFTVWAEDPARYAAFEAATVGRRFARGEGLPGSAWAAGEAVWLSDVVQEANFPRLSVALDHGLRTACAFPLTAGVEVRGIIELFMDGPRPRDEALLAELATVGSVLALARREPNDPL